MQTLFEVGFVLAFVLPPAAVVAGACAMLGSSFVSWRSHANRPPLPDSRQPGRTTREVYCIHSQEDICPSRTDVW